MMKKLVVLFIAVAALFAFSACEPYAVTLDETGSVELDDEVFGTTISVARPLYERPMGILRRP